MAVVDFILNLAMLMLWLNWRTIQFDPLVKSFPASLVGTLRRAAPYRFKAWHYLLFLLAVLFVRALLYWQIGPPLDWMPLLRLGPLAISFRSDFFSRMLLFSMLSFTVTLAIFYMWLLLFSLVNGHGADPDPLQGLIRLHLGQFDRWPWPLKLVLPLLLTLLLWQGLSLLFVRLELIPQAGSGRRLEQAMVIGLNAYLMWKYVIVACLALCVLTNYVYLGNHSLWNFVSLTGRNLLRPLRWLPLRVGKADLAPVVGIALIFFGANIAERKLAALYEHLPL